MFYKNKDRIIDKMFEYLKDNFFDNELLLFHNFNDLNLNYNFETKKYLNENFIFQNINKLFSKKKNISKLSLKYSIDSINKIKFYNFFELNILKNENFDNLKKYKKEKKIFEYEYSFYIFNLKNNFLNLKIFLKKRQKNINSINLKNQKILDENFKNISNNFIKLNFLYEIKKNKIDIENMKIISQFPEYLNR